MELYFDTGFMLFGLGFFLYVANVIKNDDNTRYSRRVADTREFGFDTSRRSKWFRYLHR